MERWIDQELMPGEAVAQVYEIAKYPSTLICHRTTKKVFCTFHFLCQIWIKTNGDTV